MDLVGVTTKCQHCRAKNCSYWIGSNAGLERNTLWVDGNLGDVKHATGQVRSETIIWDIRSAAPGASKDLAKRFLSLLSHSGVPAQRLKMLSSHSATEINFQTRQTLLTSSVQTLKKMLCGWNVATLFPNKKGNIDFFLSLSFDKIYLIVLGKFCSLYFTFFLCSFSSFLF
jgi:hypothetical protein